jgi:hypothetical protein
MTKLQVAAIVGCVLIGLLVNPVLGIGAFFLFMTMEMT